MPSIVLHGALRREFGGPYALDVATPAEAFRALEANFPGRFFAHIRDGVYRVIRGDLRKGMELDASELGFGIGKASLHIVPIPSGSNKKGRARARQSSARSSWLRRLFPPVAVPRLLPGRWESSALLWQRRRPSEPPTVPLPCSA